MRTNSRAAWQSYAATLVMLVIGASSASAQMRITEWQYQGGDTTTLTSEFIEFTNIGVAAIDMTGWSYDDSSQTPGSVSLGAFGLVAPGESVILCEGTAADFRTVWGLPGTVKVIGGNDNNLSRNDEINLYDNTNTLVDRLTYGDQNIPGSIRTNGRSGWPCAQAVGANNALGWRLSQIGDSQGSFASSFFDLGSPGSYTSFTCPADPTGACCVVGDCLILTQQECTGEGLYQGDGTTCAPNNCPAPSNAVVRITEFMHTGVGLEFIEIRNMMAGSVNLTGWSFSDESRVPGQVSLTSLGTLAAGEIAIICEASASDFRTDWSLPPTLKVLGGNSVNIGAQDEINIYDNSAALIDRLTYGQVACSIDADGRSGYPCSTAVGTNDILEWRRASLGDAQGSVANIVGDIGRPGFYSPVACSNGSCCSNNTCSLMSQGDCLSAQGLYFGDGSTCVSDPCPPLNTTDIRITEFMYQGANGEFLELTNMGETPVNLSGWSFADTCQPPGVFMISGLGTIDPGESVIVTDVSPAAFSAAWGLAGVTVVSLASSELGRNDVITIHDANGAIVDTLHYGDQDFPGTVLTQNSSAWPLAIGVGEDQIGRWVLSTVSDAQNSATSSGGDIGNPGLFQALDIPAASTWGLVVLTLLLLTTGTVCLRRGLQSSTTI